MNIIQEVVTVKSNSRIRLGDSIQINSDCCRISTIGADGFYFWQFFVRVCLSNTKVIPISLFLHEGGFHGWQGQRTLRTPSQELAYIHPTHKAPSNDEDGTNRIMQSKTLMCHNGSKGSTEQWFG